MGRFGYFYDEISEVQKAQGVALIDTVERQSRQYFVVGSAGGASFSRLSLLICRITRKTKKAMIMKLTRVLMKIPQFTVTAPASWAISVLGSWLSALLEDLKHVAEVGIPQRQ